MIPSVIQTASGDKFDYLNMEGNSFNLVDICHALRNICRFNGHSRFFYSVLQHSILVNKLSKLYEPTDKLVWRQALLHDAHEAYVGDCPTPLKQLLPDYKKIASAIDAEIMFRFNLPEEIHPAVRHADLKALAIEKELLMGDKDSIKWNLPELDDRERGVGYQWASRAIGREEMSSVFFDCYMETFE